MQTGTMPKSEPFPKHQSESNGRQSGITKAWWFQPLVVISIGLHGLLLTIPVPEIAPPEEPIEETEPEIIDVVTLPELIAPPAAPEPEAEELIASPQRPEPEPVIQPEPTPEPIAVEAEPQLPQPTDPELADSELDSLETNDAETDGSTDPIPLTLDERMADSSNYQYVATNTKGSDVSGKSFDWMTQIGIFDFKDDDPTPPVSIDVPLAQCPDPTPIKAIIGIHLDADGNRLSDLVPLQSTGYDILNEKALELASSMAYPAFGAETAYMLSIPVNCN
ncbi:MAG: hypothetical protein AAFR42_10040 [Cyanobacteria bacterium J06628_6]